MMESRAYAPLLIVLVVNSILGSFVVFHVLNRVSINYKSQRENIFREEDTFAFGSNLRLEPSECIVNDILMAAKHKELDEGFRAPSKFAPSKIFFESSKLIENSEVFRLIKMMPKGGVLHSHASAIVSQEYVFNITYRENLYVCETINENVNRLEFYFFDKPNNDCDWRLISDLRKNIDTARYLNERINRQLSMIDRDRSSKKKTNGNVAWTKFDEIFKFLSPLLKYRPVHEDHFYRGLEELFEDNVIYLELRATLHPIYELNGTVYNAVEVARFYRDVAERFVKNNPKFVSVKLIYAPKKTSDTTKFYEYLRVARQLKISLPDFFVGFDLVGQEDTLPTLSMWINELMAIGRNISFFFHAGETNWNGISVDYNLIDAVLLNTKRIGHGYALVKHPKILQLVKDKNIALEICPISNQVLGLVDDLRNHPAQILFAKNFPIVVSNDDPGLWGARGLSYDFYEAFVGIMSAHADLRAIKQLAINSIKYSSLNETEKIRAMSIWSDQWHVFVQSCNMLINNKHSS